MHKAYIRYSILAAIILLGACTREEMESRSEDRMQDLSVSLNNENQATKSGSNSADVLIGEMPIASENGETIFLSVYSRPMGDIQYSVVENSAETKGSPVTGSLFGAGRYSDFNLNVYDGSSAYVSKDKSGATSTMNKVQVSYDSTEKKWKFNSSYYWPDSSTKELYFAAIMPRWFINGITYGSDWQPKRINTLTWDDANKAFSFEYTTDRNNGATDVVSATDILDVITGLNCQTRKSYDGKVQITLKHALVGVQFKTGDIYGTIKTVSLRNFYKSGKCTVKTDTITWTSPFKYMDDAAYLNPREYRQSFEYTPTDSDRSGNTNFDKTDTKEKTFMIVPQELRSDAELKIVTGYTVHPEISLKFSEIATKTGMSTDWNDYVGQILTFTISSKKVSVNVDDTVSGSKKSNIVIKNDGSCSVYLRAAIVGEWLNSNGNMLSKWSPENSYGKFNDATSGTFPSVVPGNWVKHTDGYYYYTKILPAGYAVSQNLFNSFELTGKPSMTGISSFQMNIVVQAVEADINKAKAAWGTGIPTLTTEEDKGKKVN